MIAYSLPDDRLLTAEDLDALPDDGQRYELLQGELIVSPAPGTVHQRVIRRLSRLLDDAVTASAFGEMFQAPFEARLSAQNVVQPDLLVVASAEMDRLTDRRLEGAPAIAIEVISPSSERIDRGRKASLHMESGVREYWIVDPAQRRIVIHRPNGESSDVDIVSSGAATSRIISGFTVELAVLFAQGPFESA